jgi:hypothetical protein
LLGLLLIVRILGLIVLGDSALTVDEHIQLNLWGFPQLITVLITKDVFVGRQEISIGLFEGLGDLIELSLEVVLLVDGGLLEVEGAWLVRESALLTRNSFRVELRLELILVGLGELEGVLQFVRLGIHGSFVLENDTLLWDMSVVPDFDLLKLLRAQVIDIIA